MQYSTKYIFLFAGAVCLACSMMISVAAVGLRERQERNKVLDRRKNVLLACQLMKQRERLSADEVEKRFEGIEIRAIDIDTGEHVKPEAYDPDAVVPGGDNLARLQELPVYAQIYLVMENGNVDALVLPIHGKGLWSTLYGFLALEADTKTVRGLTFYEHGETPGLGGEVDNDTWKAKWIGKVVYDGQWNVKIGLVKGRAAPDDIHHVDGLSGATLTSRGVTNLLNFWLGEDGYAPYLRRFREEFGAA